MALYSVWDWDHNAWAVYRTPQTVSVGDDPTPARPARVSALGADPDTQMKPLPQDARFIGYDHMCRGEVRVAGGSPASLGIDMPSNDDMKKYLIGGAIGAAVAWWWRRR